MSAHNGMWRYVANGWGEEGYTQDQIERMIAAHALNEDVRTKVHQNLYRAIEMLHALERADAGAVCRNEKIEYTMEPVNNRLFELRLKSPLIPTTNEIEFLATRYIGLDIYTRADTGIIYGVGMLEDRVDKKGLAVAPRKQAFA